MRRLDTNEFTNLKTLIEGFTTRYAGAAKLTIVTGSYTTKELGQILQELVDAHQALLDVRTKVQSAMKTQREKVAEVAPIVKALRKYLLSVHGDPHDLASMGLRPPKPRTPSTVQEAVAAVEKRRATRKARHTMGSRAREKIHGDGVSFSPRDQGTEPNHGS
jgi:hypothetical protein